MRIHFRGTAHPASLSKSLRKALAAHGHTVGIRRCEEHVAAMTGYANWHELRTVSERLPDPSPRDHEVAPAVAEGRRLQYVAALAVPYGRTVAVAVVDSMRPTGIRSAVPSAPPLQAPLDPRRPIARDELLALVAGIQGQDMAIRPAAVASRLSMVAPGRPYAAADLREILGRSVVENLALAGLVRVPEGRGVPTRLPPGVDPKLEEFVRHVGLTDEEFMMGLGDGYEEKRGMRDLERDLEAAEDAVSDGEAAGDRSATDRATERHNRLGDLVSQAEWAQDLEEAEA